MAAADKIIEVRLANAVMTSKSRLYPTKDGKWFKGGYESKSYMGWTGDFNSSNAESRNRPSFGIMEFAHTLLLALPHLKEGVAKGIYGPAISVLVGQIEQHTDALRQVDGAAKDVARSHLSLSIASKEIVEWLHELQANKKFRDMLPFLFVKSEIAKHVANQFLEWTSIVGDPQAFAASVTTPAKQPASNALLKVSKATTEEKARERLVAYITEVLAPSSEKTFQRATTVPAEDSFADWGAQNGEDAADDGVEEPVPKKTSKKRRLESAEEEVEEQVSTKAVKKRRQETAEEEIEEPAPKASRKTRKN